MSTKVPEMDQHTNEDTLETLQELSGIMDRSARIISLSGWSGIWAGVVSLVGAIVGYNWLQLPGNKGIGKTLYASSEHFDANTVKFIFLGVAVFALALGGVVYFTNRKAHRMGYINTNRLEVWMRHTNEIGKMVGAWIKHEGSAM